MTCSDIIEIVGILVSAGMGIWIATAIANGHTQERFLKEYFTNDLNRIKEECKAFFDSICFDNKSGKDIKIGFKILSMRLSAFESNLKDAFKDAHTTLPNSIQSIQVDITSSDDFNEQFRNTKVVFSPSSKNIILEKRSALLTEFSKAIIVINKASLNK